MLKLPEWSISWAKTTKTNTNNQKLETCERQSATDWRTPSAEQGRHCAFWRATVMDRYLNYTHYMFFERTGKCKAAYDELNKTVKSSVRHKEFQLLSLTNQDWDY